MSILINRKGKETNFSVITVNGKIESEKCTQIFDNIHKAPPGPILIYLDSPGGAVVVGVSLMDVLDNLASPVTFISKGNCASMGANIPHLRDSIRLCYEYTTFVYHATRYAPSGTNEEVETALEFNVARSNRLKERVRTAIGLTSDEQKAYTGQDKHVSAWDALHTGKYGMVDGIIRKDYQDGTYLIETRDGVKMIDITKHRRSDLHALPIHKD